MISYGWKVDVDNINLVATFLFPTYTKLTARNDNGCGFNAAPMHGTTQGMSPLLPQQLNSQISY